MNLGQTSAMATVLIAGCGYVGCALGRLLVADGHEVYGLKRNPENLPAGIVPVKADLALPETLGGLPTSIDYIFYTAGAGRGDEESYRRSYLDGVGRLLSSLAELGEKPKRIFFTSSTSVYDQRRGERVDETSHTAPSSFRGDIILMAERLLLADSLPGTVVRFGGIYGPDRDRLLHAVRNGEVAIQADDAHDPPHDPPHYTNRIHRDDAAGCLRHLMGLAEDSKDLEDLYLAVDHESAEEAVVLRWIADRLGVKLPTPESESSMGQVRRSGSKRCVNDRLIATGYRFLYPTFREGYEMVIDGWNDGS